MIKVGPGQPPPADPEQVRRAKAWVREVVGLTDDDAVMVQQLACREPGCPPVETVLGVMRAGGTHSKTIHKPLDAVTHADVASAFAPEPDPASEEEPEHDH